MRLRCLEVRLGRPHQEGGDVLGILVERRRRAVGVVDAAVGAAAAASRWRGRGNTCCTSRPAAAATPAGGVLVALQQRHDVVGAVLLILREHVEHESPGSRARSRAPWRSPRGRAASPSGKLDRRRREVIRRPAGPLDHLALVVRRPCTLYSAAITATCAGVKPGPPGSREIAERQQLQAVAGLADLVDRP